MRTEMETLLITGGTGFVGKCLLGEIKDRNEKMNVVTTSRRTCPSNAISHVRWDVTSTEPPALSPDTIIHAATPASAALNASDPSRMFWIIVEGMRQLIKFAESCERPPTIVFLSSGAVYGEMPDDLVKFPENFVGSVSPLDPKSAYANGKRAAEFLLTEAAARGVCKSVVTRLFAFSGENLPLDRHFAIGNFVRDAATRKEIVVRGDGSAIRSYLDGSDMARWILAAAKNGNSEFAYHIGSDEPISIGDLAEVVAVRAEKFLGFKPRIRYEALKLSTDGVNRYVPETSETERSLSVNQLVSLEESIDLMLGKVVSLQ